MDGSVGWSASKIGVGMEGQSDDFRAERFAAHEKAKLRPGRGELGGEGGLFDTPWRQFRVLDPRIFSGFVEQQIELALPVAEQVHEMSMALNRSMILPCAFARAIAEE